MPTCNELMTSTACATISTCTWKYISYDVSKSVCPVGSTSTSNCNLIKCVNFDLNECRPYIYALQTQLIVSYEIIPS